MNDPRDGLVSASTMAIAKECPGAIALVNRLTEEHLVTSSHTQYTASGIRQHNAHSTGKSYDLSLEEEEAVSEREEALKAVADQLFPSGYTESYPERMWYMVGGNALFSGEVDRLIFEGNTALIPDFKTVRWSEVPDSDENIQLRTYAVLVKRNCPQFKRIYVAIVQTGHAVDPVLYDEAHLWEAEREIANIAMATLWNAPERKAGVHCKHCKARAFCPEARAYVEIVRQEALTLNLDLLEGPALGTVLDKLDMYDNVRDAIREYARAKLEAAPDPASGWEVTRTIFVRKFVNVKKAIGHLAKMLSEDVINDALSLSITKIERAYKQAAKERHYDQNLDEFMGDYLEENQRPGHLQKIKRKRLLP